MSTKQPVGLAKIIKHGYIRKSARTDWMSGPDQNRWAQHILGTVDIDPAAHPSQIIVARAKYYGEGEPGDEDDGFTAPWHKHGKGRTWINPDWGERPPTSNPSPCFNPISKWIQKMAQEGKLGASILFVGPGSTETGWFHKFIGPMTPKAADDYPDCVGANAFCLVKGRIQFRASDAKEETRKGSAPTKANVTALWTRDPEIYDRYVRTMDSVGIVVENRPLDLPED